MHTQSSLQETVSHQHCVQNDTLTHSGQGVTDKELTVKYDSLKGSSAMLWLVQTLSLTDEQVDRLSVVWDEMVELEFLYGHLGGRDYNHWTSAERSNFIRLLERRRNLCDYVMIQHNVDLPPDLVLDPDFSDHRDLGDLKFVPYGATFLKSKSSRHDVKKDLSYGLVGIESNPGPPKKSKSQAGSVMKTQVIKMVRERAPEKGSLGRRIGSGVGGFLGDMAQKAVMGITGMGDYSVTNNTLFNGTVRASGPPQFLRGKAGPSRVLHREYLQDISTIGSAFNIKEFPINPTNPNTFPWLSKIAANYEQFKVHGLVFEFVSTSATAVASTNTALGTVIMATQYNSLDPPFVSKLAMEQYEFAVATNPAQSAIHPVECSPNVGAPEYLYCSQVAPTTGDLRFTQLGEFSIATVGQQAAAVIGELWISYDIEFVKPRLLITTTESDSSDTQTFFGVWRNGGASIGYTYNQPFLPAKPSSNLLVSPGSHPGVVFNNHPATNTYSRIQFPPDFNGTFLISFTWWTQDSINGLKRTLHFSPTPTRSDGLKPAYIFPDANTGGVSWARSANIQADAAWSVATMEFAVKMTASDTIQWINFATEGGQPPDPYPLRLFSVRIVPVDYTV